MAKKQLSIYLSEDILDLVDDYMDEYNLKNRTIAIERIILEWEMMNRLSLNISNKEETETKNYRKSKKDIQDEMIDEGLDDIFEF